MDLLKIVTLGLHKAYCKWNLLPQIGKFSVKKGNKSN